MCIVGCCIITQCVLIFMRTPTLITLALSPPTTSPHCMHPPLSLSLMCVIERICGAIVTSLCQLELSHQFSIVVTITIPILSPLYTHFIFVHVLQNQMVLSPDGINEHSVECQRTIWWCKKMVAPLPQWTSSIICWLLRNTLKLSI